MKKVIDSNVIIHGNGSVQGELFTVPGVTGEIESTDSGMRYDSLDISVREPGETYLEEVRSRSKEINSPTSGVDESLVALALDMEAVLVTDDRAAQNLALHLEADFEGFMDDAVEEKRRWIRICGNCGAEAEGTTCSACGSSTRLKPDRYS